jgi:asparagine synthase (glutamine-hydrolysing)
MTRRYVTVAVAGDGADEVFGGYTRYAHERLARLYGRLPRPLARRLAAALTRLPTRRAGRFWELMALIRERAELIQLPQETRYVSQYGNLYTPLLRELYSRKMQEARLADAETFVARLMRESSALNPVDRLLDVDINGYLVDNIFVKVDIASMAHSLEVRSPMVDQEVVSLAEQLPPSLKLWGLRGKRILRMAMADLVPPRIMHRPKQGFGIPHARWLRGDLRSMARDVLLSPRALGRGYFEPAALRRLLDDHDSGLVDHGLRIWNLLWLELWHRRFIDAGAEDRVPPLA